MAYIAPDSTIKFLKNVPLDNTYNHSIIFDTLTNQYLYFNGLVKYMVTEQSYQRVHRNAIRVNIKADNLYDCNYVIFKNSSFGDKWFYAFISSVEYINNTVSEVTFEIDVLQTWMFDYELKHCFVEREHSPTDFLGENIEPENVDLGEYVNNNDYNAISSLSDLIAILGIISIDAETYSTAIVDGKIYDNIYGGLKLSWYRMNAEGIAQLNEDIASKVQQPDEVGALYMCPTYLVPEAFISGVELSYGEIDSNQHSTSTSITRPAITGNETIDGYNGDVTPTGFTGVKNKKLFTYPYNFYHVDNANGSELNLRYEFFENNQPAFTINGTFTQPVRVTLRPKNYKGIPENNLLNTECLTLEGYPLCSWNIDSYHAWQAQNALQLTGKLGIGIGAGALALATGRVITGGASILYSVTDAISKHYNASIQSDIIKGNFNNGNVNCATGFQNFYGGRFSITAQKAKVIDDFFSMYGYATNVVKLPNLTARPVWNYVKTNGCVITGSIPSDDANKICKIFDNGITWWKDGSQVGNYNLNNAPITTN